MDVGGNESILSDPSGLFNESIVPSFINTNTTDPNWFYAASAQSAAAIVGLMGAFIITKMVDNKMHVRQLKSEISDYKEKMNYVQSELDKKQKYVDEIAYEEDCKLVEKYLEGMVAHIDPYNSFNVDELYNKARFDENYSHINRSVLEDKYNQDYLIKVANYHEKLVDEFLGKKKKDIDLANPPSTDELYDEASRDIPNIKKSVLEERYNLKYLTEAKAPHQEIVESTMHETSNPWLTDDRSTIPSEDLYPHPSEDNYFSIVSTLKWDKYHKYVEEIPEKEAECNYYLVLIESKERLLQASNEVANLRVNLISLFIFSILGVFVPLGMMLFDFEYMLKLRTIVYVGIFSGWLLVLVVLLDEIRKRV